MNWFQKIYKSIQESNDQTYKEIIAADKQRNDDLNAEVSSLNVENLQLKSEIDQKTALLETKTLEISNLEDLLEQYEVEDDNQELIDYLNNKHRQAKIVYNGRYLITGEKISVPVNLMITPNDPVIIQDLKEWGLYRTGEDPETLAPKIHAMYKSKHYKYRYDNNAWGKYEFWEYFYEMVARAKSEGLDKLPFDCDSHAQALAGYYIAAGIPRWRVRVVVGNTYVGGHSTNYLYSTVDNKFHHLNSTYGICTGYDQIHKFPVHEDAKSNSNKSGKDMLGVYNTWMSFNDLICWCDFDDDIPENLKIIN